ncbi:MAG: DUF2218 domain-containing protein [Roseibium sp.]
MLVSTLTIKTASASKYLQQLCKHFAHKVPVDWDTSKGEVSFPGGYCRLDAEPDQLAIRCEADEEVKLTRVKAIIDDHVKRFAWREDLTLEWQSDRPS